MIKKHEDESRVAEGVSQLIDGQVHAEGAADNRHDIGESTADTRCNRIMRQLGRVGWQIIAVVFAVAILFGCYSEYRVNEAEEKAKATELENAELKIKVNGQLKGIARRDEQIETHKRTILSLHEAAENEKQIHHKYYEHMGDRAEGLTDHIMSLNDQLDAKDVIVNHHIKLAKRWRGQRDIKNQFMEIAEAIIADNPARLKKILKDVDFPIMPFYKLGVTSAVGLQSFNILEYIQSLDGWNKTIPISLATKVRNPKTVPLADYQKLKSSHDQMAGRLNDIKYSYENQKLKLLSLENKNREMNDEDKQSFKLIIDNLPPTQKAAWDHYADRLEKNGQEKVHNYLKQESKNNPEENNDTAGSCGAGF